MMNFLIAPLKIPGNKHGGQVKAAEQILKFAKSRGLPLTEINTSSGSSFSGFKSRLYHFRHKVLCLYKYWKESSKHDNAQLILFCGTVQSIFFISMFLFLAKLRGNRCNIFIRNTSLYINKFNPIVTHILSYLLNLSGEITVQSQKFVPVLRSSYNYHGKLSVYKNWINTTTWSADIDHSTHHSLNVVFVGQLTDVKGFDVILTIIEGVDAERFNFSIYGEGKLSEKLHRLCRVGGRKNVEHIGWLENEYILDALSDKHVLLFPTRHPEGLPNVIVEAMSKGLCILSSNSGFISDMVTSGVNGYVIPRDQPEMYISALNELYNDPEKLKSMRFNSRQFYEDHHSPHTGEAHLLKLLSIK